MERSNRSEEWHQVLVEASPHAILIAEGTRIVVANRVCEALLAARRSGELIGQDLQTFFGSEVGTAIAALADQYDSTGSVPTFEARVMRLDGRERELEVTLSAVPEADRSAVQMLMRDATERLLNDRLRDMSGDKLRRLSGSLVEAREDERRRIARELHDELGQRLSAIKMEISSLLGSLPPGMMADGRGASALRMIDQTMTSVRRIAANLRPAMLDDLGLEAAIEWLTTDWADRAGLGITVHCDAVNGSLNDAAKTAIYRTVQEALTNVTRHARASRVDVELRREESHVAVAISDDGQGLAPDAIGKTGSFGLIGMRERALLLGGALAIKESDLGGCRLELRVPITYQTGPFTPLQGNA